MAKQDKHIYIGQFQKKMMMIDVLQPLLCSIPEDKLKIK